MSAIATRSPLATRRGAVPTVDAGVGGMAAVVERRRARRLCEDARARRLGAEEHARPGTGVERCGRQLPSRRAAGSVPVGSATMSAGPVGFPTSRSSASSAYSTGRRVSSGSTAVGPRRKRERVDVYLAQRARREDAGGARAWRPTPRQRGAKRPPSGVSLVRRRDHPAWPRPCRARREGAAQESPSGYHASARVPSSVAGASWPAAARGTARGRPRRGDRGDSSSVARRGATARASASRERTSRPLPVRRVPRDRGGTPPALPPTARAPPPIERPGARHAPDILGDPRARLAHGVERIGNPRPASSSGATFLSATRARVHQNVPRPSPSRTPRAASSSIASACSIDASAPARSPIRASASLSPLGGARLVEPRNAGRSSRERGVRRDCRARIARRERDAPVEVHREERDESLERRHERPRLRERRPRARHRPGAAPRPGSRARSRAPVRADPASISSASRREAWDRAGDPPAGPAPPALGA